MKADLMQLHLGILQMRLDRIKGKMQVCLHKMNMTENKDIDQESEKLKFANFNQQFEETEHNLKQYEDKVLLLTKI